MEYFGKSVLTGIFVESSCSDLFAALPDVVSSDVVVAGAHVESIVHGFIVLAVPLKITVKIKKGYFSLTELRMLSALSVIAAALVQK